MDSEQMKFEEYVYSSLSGWLTEPHPEVENLFDEDKFPKHSVLMTRIDSDEQPVVNDDAFMRYAFHSLYTSQDMEKTIESLMEHIGTRFNVSRVYVFENNDANTHCNNTFE